MPFTKYFGELGVQAVFKNKLAPFLKYQYSVANFDSKLKTKAEALGQEFDQESNIPDSSLKTGTVSIGLSYLF